MNQNEPERREAVPDGFTALPAVGFTYADVFTVFNDTLCSDCMETCLNYEDDDCYGFQCITGQPMVCVVVLSKDPNKCLSGVQNPYAYTFLDVPNQCIFEFTEVDT
ncbi:hypothetical protein CAPTEDRAFT_196602 [Capitella teleta]|uniref:Uncharacterized protein n=1 Tax=Capitella teleta TaxID=283909 RepID=R7U810_CAPTE|nr:hypothetical protein CAPTEDRAFT_196602 [Capitella teleta]|eukprot:ELU02119.1 hypothetical protein CAPTEDRAFT_196602 [Capitella teleta]